MKFQSHYYRWTASLALLGVVALSSCAKTNEPAATNSPTSQPVAASTSAAPAANVSTTGVAPKGKDCPSNAPIKGVDTKKRGKIYHDTKYPDYKTVQPTVCFATVADAQKAGYKTPK